MKLIFGSGMVKVPHRLWGKGQETRPTAWCLHLKNGASSLSFNAMVVHHLASTLLIINSNEFFKNSLTAAIPCLASFCSSIWQTSCLHASISSCLWLKRARKENILLTTLPGWNGVNHSLAAMEYSNPNFSRTLEHPNLLHQDPVYKISGLFQE